MARPTAFVRAALVGVLVLAACGGDDDGEAVEPEPPAEARTALEVCAAVIDERDPDVAAAGRDASLDVVLWSRQGAPSDAEVEAATAAMRTWRADLVADRERLAGAEVDDAEAWDAVLGQLDADIGVLDERLAALEAPDPDSTLDDLPVGRTPDEDLAPALEALGLDGRDCEVVASHPGTDPEHRAFTSEAAGACAAIVTRRRAGTFSDDVSAGLEAVAAVAEGEPVEVDEQLVAAVERVRDEWAATTADLAGVDPAEAPDIEAWDQVLTLARQRVDGYGQRAEALRAGDQRDIAAAFTPDALGDPGFEGFAPNGLDQRDCRSVSP